MNTKTIGILGSFLLVSALSLQSVLANPPGDGYGKGHGEGYERDHGRGYGMGMPGHHATTGHLLRGLLRSQKEMGLSDDQVNKIKTIQLELDKTRIKTEADIMVAEREAEALLDDPKSNLSDIEAKIKQSEGLQTSLRMAAIKARREAVATLTPEQNERLRMVHERMKGMRDMEGAPKGHPKKEEPKKDTKPNS